MRLWAGRAPAVSWAPEWVPFEILVWADNIFLVSSSMVEIARRKREIAEVFGRKGLRFNRSSLEILPRNAAEMDATRISLCEGTEFVWVQILVVVFLCMKDACGKQSCRGPNESIEEQDTLGKRKCQREDTQKHRTNKTHLSRTQPFIYVLFFGDASQLFSVSGL